MFFDYLHDLTFKIKNNLIEIDKIIRIKKYNDEFQKIKKDNQILTDKIKNKISTNHKNLLANQKIGKYLSHHELHAYSVIHFIKKNNINIDDIYILVNDGSGSMYFKNNLPVAECISLYHYNFKQKRIKNLFSYLHNIDSNLLKNYSPSLMYLLGCNHFGLILGEEGKMLALESKVKEFNSDQKIKKVDNFINILLKVFIKNFNNNLIENNRIFYRDKVKTLKEFNDIFKKIFYKKEIPKKELFDNKYITAYAIQSLYEKIMIYIVDYSVKKYNIKDLGGAGGGFFNVKLNNLILNTIKGKLIINPIAGDLGTNYFRNKNNIIDSYQNRYTLNKIIFNFLNHD